MAFISGICDPQTLLLCIIMLPSWEPNHLESLSRPQNVYWAPKLLRPGTLGLRWPSCSWWLSSIPGLKGGITPWADFCVSYCSIWNKLLEGSLSYWGLNECLGPQMTAYDIWDRWTLTDICMPVSQDMCTYPVKDIKQFRNPRTFRRPPLCSVLHLRTVLNFYSIGKFCISSSFCCEILQNVPFCVSLAKKNPKTTPCFEIL